jgi:hypothetical protein
MFGKREKMEAATSAVIWGDVDEFELNIADFVRPTTAAALLLFVLVLHSPSTK